MIIDKNQINQLLTNLSKSGKLPNNAHKARQVLFDEYGIDSDIDTIHEYFYPTVQELEQDYKIMYNIIC